MVFSLLPVLPINKRPINIRLLRSFAATTQQQHNPLSGLSVIDTQPWPYIQAKLPNTVSTKPVIAKIAMFHPVRTSDQGHLSFPIT